MVLNASCMEAMGFRVGRVLKGGKGVEICEGVTSWLKSFDPDQCRSLSGPLGFGFLTKHIIECDGRFR